MSGGRRFGAEAQGFGVGEFVAMAGGIAPFPVDLIWRLQQGDRADLESAVGGIGHGSGSEGARWKGRRDFGGGGGRILTEGERVRVSRSGMREALVASP
jgi:hypothetical protein